MAEPRSLLARLLNTPGLAAIVPRRQPQVLHRVIQACGLEDSVELVALATPSQLSQIFDLDIWRARTPGVDETFDADRFGVWIAVLMEAGADVAAEKLLGLDIDLVIAGFSRHLAAFDGAVVAGYTMLDGVEVPGRAMNRRVSEIGGYAIEAKRSSAWEPLVELLAHLEAEQREYFHRLMRGCVRLSNGARQEDASHQLLEDDDQHLFDLGGDRQARREEQGYVSPAQAHAFLRSARDLRLDAGHPPSSPIARAYFRAFAATFADAARDASHEVADAPLDHEAAAPPHEPEVADARLESVLDVLRDAGVIAQSPRALLGAGDSKVSRLAWIEPHVVDDPASAEELAYLANAIITGCAVQGRPFTEREAGDAVVAICNLGLQNWPSRWRDRDLITAFQVGWSVLYRDVCLHTAKRLIDALGEVR